MKSHLKHRRRTVSCRIVCRTVLVDCCQLALRCPIAYPHRCEFDYLLRSKRKYTEKCGHSRPALNSFPLNRSLMLLFYFSLIFLTCSGSTSGLKLIHPLEIGRVLPLQWHWSFPLHARINLLQSLATAIQFTHTLSHVWRHSQLNGSQLICNECTNVHKLHTHTHTHTNLH